MGTLRKKLRRINKEFTLTKKKTCSKGLAKLGNSVAETMFLVIFLGVA